MKLTHSKITVTYLAIKICLISVLIITLLNGCAEEKLIQIDEKAPCIQEVLTFDKIKLETYCNEDTCITCPLFMTWDQPFYVGDTLALSISAEPDFSGAAIINGKSVYVTVTTRLGDEETYWLRGNSWPCEIRISDFEIYHAVIFYNNYKVGNAFPNNNLLEVNITGDTLIASYKSYCTENIVKDTIFIYPN